MKTYYIYTLSNPNTGEVFYVGCTTDTERRLKQHCIMEGKYSLPKANFGMNAKDGYIFHHKINPVLEVLETFEADSVQEAEQVEQYWMQQLNAWGYKLRNRIKKETQREYVINKSSEFFDKKYKSYLQK